MFHSFEMASQQAGDIFVRFRNSNLKKSKNAWYKNKQKFKISNIGNGKGNAASQYFWRDSQCIPEEGLLRR